MTISKETLAELERLIVDIDPLSANTLSPGLSKAKIRKKLNRAGVSGEIDVLVDLYSWHDGTDTSGPYPLGEKGLFPWRPFHFPLLDLAVADFLSFRGLAQYRPALGEAVGRYFPVLWNGVVSWIAIDLAPGEGNRVVLIELEPTPAIREAYSSAGELIADLISACRENRTLKCFGRKRRSSAKRRRSVVQPPLVAKPSEPAEPPSGEVQCFATDGGPHMILPNAARDSWNGVGEDFDDILDPSTDYGRACLVEEPVGLLSVGNHQALVLSGSPPMSGWMKGPQPDSIDVLVFNRWSEEGPEELAEKIVPKLTSKDFANTGLKWTVEGDGATLMSAVDRPGNSAYGEIPMRLSSGAYEILQARYEGRKGAFWIFRIVPQYGKSIAAG
ncbi:MAG: hypothetical protein EHM23_01980 [Acidobacteria bacterium]|nr:MAG: hypothetical protein EHM23_08890 [Acidobacteriota bacterium]RPJ63287.1 MAG: hypothetical protein EHM23_01980 [Acidobacteriota bacterium]